MWFETEITIPAGTAEKTPVEVTLQVSYGVIHHVVIEAASGCRRYAAIRVYYHEHQIYPLNPEKDIALDAIPRIFDDRQEVLTAPYMLKIKGYSPNATRSHTYRVGVGILRPEAFPEYREAESLITKIARLLGVR